MSAAPGPSPARAECRVLGPLEVVGGGWPVPLGGRKQRLLLAVLLLAAGRTVSADRLVDVLGGDDAGDKVRNTLQVHVSALRKLLQAAGTGLTVVRREPGYAVDVGTGQLDLLRFRAGVEAGTAALREGRAAAAVAALDAALGLWRGAALADLADEPALQAELGLLEKSRLAAVAEELGADPVPELRDLERAVLATEDLRGVERENNPFLLFQDATGTQRVVVLDRARSPVTVGRGPGNAVSLGWDREVSRMHARLEWSRLGWVLVDGSRNGSLVDGRQVLGGRRLLRDGAVVRIGETPLLFRSATAAAPAEGETAGVTVDAPVALLGGLPPEEADVLGAVLAAPLATLRSAGAPEELLAEALALPASEVAHRVGGICRRLGVRDTGRARVLELRTRALALGIASV